MPEQLILRNPATAFVCVVPGMSIAAQVQLLFPLSLFPSRPPFLPLFLHHV